MKLSQLFVKEAMDLQLVSASKSEALQTLATRFAQVGGVSDVAAYVAALEAREAQSTTGVGEGIAIPHAQHESVKQPSIIFARSEQGVDWSALDQQPAHLIFMIAAPAGAGGEHLKALASLSSVLMNPEAKAALLDARNADEVVAVFEQYEAIAQTSAPVESDAYILAVTACPTGIAHTFMAEEKLKQAGKAAGVNIKVETNGQGGIGNRLTSSDIEKATAIIVAADKNVEMARFHGKPVIITKVADGINKADELVARAMKADAPIYQASNDVQLDTVSNEQESLGRQFYKHLMNGVSHMLPFVVAGGMLIAISFMWGINAFDPKDPSYNVAAEFIFTLGKISFAMMLPIFAGFIGQSIADRPGLVLGVIGGILASPGIMSYTGIVQTLEVQSSGFLGALVAGFLAGGIVYVLRIAFSWLPKSLEGLKPIFIYPILGTLLMGLLMIFVLNAPMAAVSNSLTAFIDSIPKEAKFLVGFIVGGMMSIDMGGPINKAAYVTGTALLTEAGAAGSDVMAAVMVGGMVPPLAIALAATLNKYLFSEAERNSAYVNYVMGAAFITEGAIPFAAANPLKVIPPLALGAGVAGALSMVLGIVSKVPHGGFFAVLTGAVTQPFAYLIIWLVGGFIGAFLLMFTLRKKNQ